MESIHNQSFPDWQAIIVDDGSDTDIVNEIESELVEERVKIIRRIRNPQGASTCRNIGIANSTGKYIIFLDSDDLLAPYCLEHRVEIMEENPELDFAVFPMILFNDMPEDGDYLWNRVIDENDLERFLRLDAVWQTTGPIWKKSALEKIGGFTEGLQCWQDVDIHLKALFAGLNYRTFYKFAPDCYYRRHSEGSISQGRINTPEKLESRWHVFLNSYRHIAAHNGKNQKTLYKNLRIMLQGILLSSIKARNFVFFMRVFLSPITIRVLLPADLVKIKGMFLVYLFRMDKLSRVAQYTESVIKGLVPDSAIGKIKYQ